MSDECVELKNIKYKSMLLSGNSEEKKETVANLSNLDNFLEEEKKTSSYEPWPKLDKSTKLNKINEFVDKYCLDNNYSDSEKKSLLNYLCTCIDRKRLLRAKEVIYNKETGTILSIPLLIYNSNTKKFTLKRCEKRQSTLKCLAPKKNKSKEKSNDK
jgi:hypothetical protein